MIDHKCKTITFNANKYTMRFSTDYIDLTMPNVSL